MDQPKPKRRTWRGELRRRESHLEGLVPDELLGRDTSYMVGYQQHQLTPEERARLVRRARFSTALDRLALVQR